jgi:hypothetical protein
VFSNFLLFSVVFIVCMIDMFVWVGLSVRL